MGMRIRTNTMSLVAQRQLTNNTKSVGDSIEKLSSGYRINRSADDAAGLAVSETMRANIRSLNQAKRNTNDAVSMLQVAEGGMQEMTNIIIRMRELTMQSATDTINDLDRSYLNREYTQLADEIDRIAGTTEFNGRRFFVKDSDTPDEYTIQVGKDNEPGKDTISIDLRGLKFNSNDLGIGKEDEIGPMAADGKGPSREAISAKIGTLDNALNHIAQERANIGSLQSRFSSTINSQSIAVENLSASRSRIVDVDFAEETAELTKGKILSQSGVAVLSQANQWPEMALALLRQ